MYGYNTFIVKNELTFRDWQYIQYLKEITIYVLRGDILSSNTISTLSLPPSLPESHYLKIFIQPHSFSFLGNHMLLNMHICFVLTYHILIETYNELLYPITWLTSMPYY